MSKFLLVILFVSFSFSAYSQIEKGNKMLTGSAEIGINNSKYSSGNSNKGYTLSLNPRYGIFLTDRTVVGANLSAQMQHNYYSSNSESINRYYLFAGPFIRRYIPITDNFFFYLNASVGLSSTIDRTKINDEKWNNKATAFGFGLDFTPGLTYLISRKIGLELNLGNAHISGSKTNNKNPTYSESNNSSSIRLSGLGAGIGLTYYIN